MKKILIAIPTARYIEPDTFKSIYDLVIPRGYEADFQCFFGYRVDQVRNLIADWVVKGYDYLFAVDHDMVFPKDTLQKLLAHDKDIVSAVYRQRLEPQVIELYNHQLQHLDISQIDGSLKQIGACGFGCVLVKKQPLVSVGYPQFMYHHALDHNETFSEDLDFCTKAMAAKHTIWADTSILCGHIGSTTMHVQLPQKNPVETRLRELSLRDDQPRDHVEYLKSMDIRPKVIYDIGACVMHWTKEAEKIWPSAKFFLVDAMDHAKFLYEESGHDYYCGPVGDVLGREVDFYENPMDPAGNSYYKENTQFFNESHKVKKKLTTLDTLMYNHFHYPPDLIKIDVQGAELDVLKGAPALLSKCKDIIIEMQHEEYNLGAPKVAEVTEYLNEQGFVLVKQIHRGGVDGDYHFTRQW